MTEKTKVYFVGGVMAGQSLELPEPLPSIYEARQKPTPPTLLSVADGDSADVVIKVELYILHSLKRRVGSVPARVYIHQDMQFGGIADADLAHIPG